MVVEHQIIVVEQLNHPEPVEGCSCYFFDRISAYEDLIPASAGMANLI
ncbi:hypothetical protein [Candidatus Magnetominusculus dajiuhuensis]